MSDDHTFVGTEAAAAKLNELRSRPGMTEQVATIRAEIDIDDAIDRWHDSGGKPEGHPVELREYLGMTVEQYSNWLPGPR